MELQTITYLIVGATFALYLGIAFCCAPKITSINQNDYFIKRKSLSYHREKHQSKAFEQPNFAAFAYRYSFA